MEVRGHITRKFNHLSVISAGSICGYKKEASSCFKEKKRGASRSCKITEGKAPYNYTMFILSTRYQSWYTLRLKLTTRRHESLTIAITCKEVEFRTKIGFFRAICSSRNYTCILMCIRKQDGEQEKKRKLKDWGMVVPKNQRNM